MKCVTSHYSQRSIDEFPDSMRTMFPDSGIVRDFTLGRIKIEYIKNHGLKRYYQNKFMSAVKMLIVVRSGELMFLESCSNCDITTTLTLRV